MTPQQHADHMLRIWQTARRLPPQTRIELIDRVIAPAANSNLTQDELLDIALARVAYTIAEV
jgi:hypothetical protein